MAFTLKSIIKKFMYTVLAVVLLGLMAAVWGLDHVLGPQDVSIMPAFVDNVEDIYNNPLSPSFGNPKGDVIIVEYSDYLCGYCKISHEELVRVLQEDKNARVIYKEFPKLGPFSTLLANASLASLRQGTDKYLKLHEALLGKHTYIGNEDALYQNAASLGLDVNKLKKDMHDDAIVNQVQDDYAVGKSLGVEIVPSFIVNGHLFPGVADYDRLKLMMEYARSPGLTRYMLRAAMVYDRLKQMAGYVRSPDSPLAQHTDLSVSDIRSKAEQGDAVEQYDLGVMYYNGKGVAKDEAEAFKWFHKAANQGHVMAQYWVGSMCEAGKGVKQDHTEAMKYFRKAAEQNNVLAQDLLGTMYIQGKGMPQDYAEAFKWLHQAAVNHEDSKAQYDLGELYAAGHGVEKNIQEAYFWFSLAVQSPSLDSKIHKEAAAAYDDAKAHLTPQQISDVEKRVAELKAKSSDGGLNKSDK